MALSQTETIHRKSKGDVAPGAAYSPATLEGGHRSDNSLASHIVVAIRVEAGEKLAIAQALRMAAAHRAKVTLLHVSEAPAERSLHWLDGIDRLHGVTSWPDRRFASVVDEKRAQMEAFVEREIPIELREGLDVRCECRLGDVAHEIARFVQDSGAGMVVLCTCPSAWRLSLWTGLSRRVAGLLPKSVVVMHARV